MASRKLSKDERDLLRRPLSINCNDYTVFEEVQTAQCLVDEIDAYGSLKFIEGGQEGAQVKLPVEAQFQDQDGIWVHALLFKRGNKIDELEIYKDDGSLIQRRPKLEDWEILVLE